MKVLVAVDRSEASRKAVEFAKSLVAGRGGAEVTLFHVADVLPEFIVSRTSDAQSGAAFRAVAQEWADTHRAEGQRLLAEYRDELVKTGVPATAIRTALSEREARPEARRVAASLAIVDEMKTGGYDVVVVGRRGTSATIESLVGSVAERVARDAAGRTVCIVD